MFYLFGISTLYTSRQLLMFRQLACLTREGVTNLLVESKNSYIYNRQSGVDSHKTRRMHVSDYDIP